MLKLFPLPNSAGPPGGGSDRRSIVREGGVRQEEENNNSRAPRNRKGRRTGVSVPHLFSACGVEHKKAICQGKEEDFSGLYAYNTIESGNKQGIVQIDQFRNWVSDLEGKPLSIVE